ncbi:hypothetical protein N431DRAFT_222844 [Stipitochalara longipes BDJ]|nr:hypothetical protein N431DRAFT_222844 [Stipitochalara longipes BDJ]
MLPSSAVSPLELELPAVVSVSILLVATFPIPSSKGVFEIEAESDAHRLANGCWIAAGVPAALNGVPFVCSHQHLHSPARLGRSMASYRD